MQLLIERIIKRKKNSSAFCFTSILAVTFALLALGEEFINCRYMVCVRGVEEREPPH